MNGVSGLNPYGGLWSGIASGVGAISNGIVALSGSQNDIQIAQAQAAAEKAKADAAAQQQKYKYYAVAGVVVLLIVGFFIYKYTKKQE
jgi:hypothetical protein